ncbi:hypothetical protein C922_03841 [Plasmodium inui San Antonio 1]|uniref:Uncharacterized protein n=1 Tax=Plasmodium inui San Antonio 1 TaxID=1237626 RepID=W7A3D9_9APIC|nr:hypothetical protein C922_03841 [Plasmodium inui San Antonio 1]EUD65858.1 hypothetical protein C922_03841 [Plasmodium inui San Antonio 1]
MKDYVSSSQGLSTDTCRIQKRNPALQKSGIIKGHMKSYRPWERQHNIRSLGDNDLGGCQSDIRRHNDRNLSWNRRGKGRDRWGRIKYKDGQDYSETEEEKRTDKIGGCNIKGGYAPPALRECIRILCMRNKGNQSNSEGATAQTK